MNNKNLILLILVLALGLLIGGAYVKYTTIPCSNNPSGDTISENSNTFEEDSTEEDNTSDTVDTIEAENDTSNDESKNTNIETNIKYTTFSSPEADFTFEYPDTWVYDERETNGTMNWGFYSKFADNHDGVPYLGVQSPIEDPGAVSHYSAGGPDSAKGNAFSFTLSVFPTNDPKTFVTYERYGAGENGGGYIYWEKGEYFANSSYLPGHKYNQMRFYSVPEKGREIGLHIAQSIKMK